MEIRKTLMGSMVKIVSFQLCEIRELWRRVSDIELQEIIHIEVGKFEWVAYCRIDQEYYSDLSGVIKNKTPIK